LQSIFWYGRSEDYDTDDIDLEFFKSVPTVWDQSTYLDGTIGKNVAAARRKGQTWYLGCATGFDAWKTGLKLNFLNPGTIYQATIYEDDGRGHIAKSTKKFTNTDMLGVALDPKGGEAIIFEPVKRK